MLQWLNITHRFGRRTVLDGVSLAVSPGQCLALLGHNGAGKTTLLRIAGGLLRPTRGQVRIDGFDAARYALEARARVGALIEPTGFDNALDGRVQLRRWARLQGLTPSQAEAEVDRVLAWVGLDRLGIDGRPVRTFSQGMRQRLGIAQALLGQPPVVLLDEPFNGLDPEARARVREGIRRLVREQNVAVVLASHQLHEVAGLCQRVAILRQGRILVEQDLQALLAGRPDRIRLTLGAPGAEVESLLRHLARSVRLLDEQAGRSTWQVALGSQSAGQLVSDLWRAGVDLCALTPVEPSLEEVYLRVEQAGTPAVASPAGLTNAADDGEPAARCVRGSPLGRALRTEWTRLATTAGLWWGLAGSLLVAVAAVLWKARQAAAQAARVGEDLYSVTSVTAFDALGLALQVGLPLWGMWVLGWASQSIAAERDRGTWRLLLLRPVGPGRWVVGKLGALTLVALLGYLCLVAAAVAAAGACFDFSEVSEMLPGGQRFVLLARDEMIGPTVWAVLRPLPVLLAIVAWGVACSATTGRAVRALVAALGGWVTLDLAGRTIGEPRVAGWLLPSHWPSWTGDGGFLQSYRDLVQGASNVTDPLRAWALMSPALWWIGCVLLAVWLTRRKAG